MRRIVARVEVDGKEVEMVFITNNMEWAASSICGLYQSRWGIEVFFKQIKQTLQVCDLDYRHSGAGNPLAKLWSALLMYRC